MKRKAGEHNTPTLYSEVFSYRKLIGLLILCTGISNFVALLIPKIISRGIDTYQAGNLDTQTIFIEFFSVTIIVFVFTYLQNIVQTYASEKVGRDLRQRLIQQISLQNFEFVQRITPAVLLTNLTSDVDGVKVFVAQAIGTVIASVCLILGASFLLLHTNWQLGLVVLLIIPLIGGTFFVILGRVKKLFGETQKIIDVLNKVINESILGSAIIRVLNSEKEETRKFALANKNARDIGFQILGYFAILIPVITFVASLATLAILSLGGHFVITGTMSLGSIAAFNSYVGILIFPIIMIGFMSGVISRSSASYARIVTVLYTGKTVHSGTVDKEIQGDISLSDIGLKFGEKNALHDITIRIKPKTKTAIIGPTAAGKTQLLYLMSGLIHPTNGEIHIDGTPLEELQKDSLHKQMGFVFQDSNIFNVTLEENIAFSEKVSKDRIDKAIKAAELGDYISSLPQGLQTVVSERGTSLSGGQKQRIMLARALALDPKVLLLDDFTARVDTNTERTILQNIETMYPDVTLISVTQKIASVEKYDQIILLMEGEIIASGTHKHLLKTSPEYVQLYESQKSTSHYEIHA